MKGLGLVFALCPLFWGFGALAGQPAGAQDGGRSMEGREWTCDPRAPRALGDGSREHPFAAVRDALSKATAGDAVVLRPGLYVEGIRLDRALVLRGPKTAVVVGPNRNEPVVDVRAKATIEGISVQGGSIGLDVHADARIREVSFSAQRLAAVRVGEARVRIDGGLLQALFDKPDLVGIDVHERGELFADRVAFDGPFRFAVRGRSARLHLNGLTIEGATVAVACLDGCDGTLTRSVLAQGRGAGIVVGSSKLAARDNLISRFEQCVAVNSNSEVILEDNATAFCALSGVSVIRAKARIAQHIHVSPASVAAVQFMESDVAISEGVLLDPGPVGIGMRLGKTVVSGTLVRGATLDRDRVFGDGLFAVAPERLTLEAPFIEDCAGTGVSVHGGAARALGLEAHHNSHAGVVSSRGAQVTLEAPHVEMGLGPGLATTGGGRLRARLGRVANNVGGAVSAECEGMPSVVLVQMGFGPREAAEASCVESFFAVGKR
jgi:nitrous oxidase accessory protein NosD